MGSEIMKAPGRARSITPGRCTGVRPATGDSPRPAIHALRPQLGPLFVSLRAISGQVQHWVALYTETATGGFYGQPIENDWQQR